MTNFTLEQQENIRTWSDGLRRYFAKNDPSKSNDLDTALNAIFEMADYEWLSSAYHDLVGTPHHPQSDASPAAQRKSRARAWRKIDRQYIEQNGELYVVEKWSRWCPVVQHHLIETRPPFKAPHQVKIKVNGVEKRVSRTIVLHFLRTGLWVDRVSTAKHRAKEVKQYQARVAYNGERISLGYYTTREERDAVVALARMGIFPEKYSK